MRHKRKSTSATAEYLKTLVLAQAVTDAIEPAPENIRHHLAAVAWWGIVGIAEQSEAGARVTLRNAIEAVYTRGDVGEKEAVENARTAIDHFAATVRDSYGIVLAAAKLRRMFHVDKWDGFEDAEIVAFVDGIKGDLARNYLRASLAEFNDAAKERDADTIRAHAEAGAKGRAERADRIKANAKARNERKARRAREARAARKAAAK